MEDSRDHYLLQNRLQEGSGGFQREVEAHQLKKIKCFVGHLLLLGYTSDVSRCDEGGSLASSTDFTKICIDVLHMAVETTGGKNSENNRMVESPIKPVKRMIQSFLIGPVMPDVL